MEAHALGGFPCPSNAHVDTHHPTLPRIRIHHPLSSPEISQRIFRVSHSTTNKRRRHFRIGALHRRSPEEESTSVGEVRQSRRDVLVMPFIAIGAYVLRSAVARADEKVAAETEVAPIAVTETKPKTKTESVPAAPAKVEVKKEEVINSRIYDATVIGEPMAVGKDKGKIWEKLMNGRIVYLGEAEQVPTRDDKELEVEILRSLTKNAPPNLSAMERTPHIAIVPSPGMGHLIPLVEFAKRLMNNHNISATFIIPNDGPLSKSQTAFLDSLPNGLNYLLLPPVNFDDLPQDTQMETRISLMVTRSLPSLRQVFKSLVAEKHMVALFIDLFGTDAFDVAIEFGVSPYVFFPSTAMALSLFLHLPKLDQEVSCEYRDLPEPVQIPGCIPVRGQDLLDPVQDRKNDAYKWVLHNAKRYMMAEGIAVNSFKELEGGALKVLLQEEPGKPKVYPVGPLIQQTGSSSDLDGSECLRWLDGQPCGSVLYISFGSGGTLSSSQLNELAMGLELSEQRFLWVVRSPNDQPNATYFNSYGHNDPLGFLPQGFLERTKNIGFVVPSWAPQAQILSHSSTGGFLTHCGWNSILETVVHGVPVIAWPLYAEQKMNAVSLNEDMKVALRPKVGENGIVGRVEIARVVKGLLEGEEGKGIRSRIRDLKDAATNVLSKDGCSTKTLAQLASKLKNKS